MADPTLCEEFAIALHPVAKGKGKGKGKKKGKGKTEHHLPVRDRRQHVVHQMVSSFSLAFGATRWTPVSFPTTKRHDFLRNCPKASLFFELTYCRRP